MQTKALLGMLLAAFAAAQDFPGQPSCATSCWESALSKIGCGTSDTTCRCASQAELASDAGGCLFTACDLGQVIKAQSAEARYCASLGIAEATTSIALSGTTGTATGAVSEATASTASSTGTGAAASTAGSGPAVFVVREMVFVVAVAAAAVV